MSLQTKVVPFLDVKSEDGDGSTFSGYAAVFNNCDQYGDVITPGAFGGSLDNFLKRGQICMDHGPVVGKPTAAREDPKGLFIEGKISDTAAGRDTKTLLKDGVFRQMSIGYRSKARKPTNVDEVKAYWAKVGYQPTSDDLENLDANRNNLSFLNAIKLFEASPVGFPANTQADIVGVKSLLGLDLVKRLSEDLRLDLKDGRKLSKSSRDKLKSIHDALHPACMSLKELLDDTDPDAVGVDTDEQPGDVDEEAKARAAANLTKARRQLSLLSLDPMFTPLD
jgi:HK97 family phage prohead protease